MAAAKAAWTVWVLARVVDSVIAALKAKTTDSKSAIFNASEIAAVNVAIADSLSVSAEIASTMATENVAIKDSTSVSERISSLIAAAKAAKTVGASSASN